MGREKGFSLFTPLIGTTIIVIAAVVSAMMLQNDVRISRALSDSFEQANQQNAAKLVKATAEVTIRKGVEQGFKKTLEKGITINYESSSIEDSFKQAIEKGIKDYLSTDLYSNMLDEISTSTGYDAQHIDCTDYGGEADSTPENCLAKGISHTSITLVDDSSNGNRYMAEFDIDRDYEGAYAVRFKNSENQFVILSLEPDTSESYPIAIDAKTMIGNVKQIKQKLAVKGDESYRNLLTGLRDGGFFSGVKEVDIYKKEGSDKRLIQIIFKGTEWGLEKDFVINLKPNGDRTDYHVPECKWDESNGVPSLSSLDPNAILWNECD